MISDIKELLYYEFVHLETQKKEIREKRPETKPRSVSVIRDFPTGCGPSHKTIKKDKLELPKEYESEPERHWKSKFVKLN